MPKTERCRIISVCSDPGGAQALLPVMGELVDRDAVVLSLVSGAAATAFPSSTRDWMVLPLDDETESEKLENLLRDFRPAVLISGAGSYNRIEHTARIAAHQQGVTVVAILDYWNEYGARFRRVDQPVERSTPDLVFALDPRSRDGVRREVGLPEDRVMITGPPNLEASLRKLRMAENQRDRIREEMAPGASVVLVFFSDPFFIGPNGEYFRGEGSAFDADGRSRFGYTPVSILRELLKVLNTSSGLASGPVTLLVKPHPRENQEPLREVLSEPFTSDIRVRMASPERTSVELIAAADAVFGMGSVILLEAALGGVPTASVQIGYLESEIYDPCVGNALGLTYPVFGLAELESVVRRAVRNELPALKGKEPLPIEGATRRAADLIEALASDSQMEVQ